MIKDFGDYIFFVVVEFSCICEIWKVMIEIFLKLDVMCFGMLFVGDLVEISLILVVIFDLGN